MSIRKIACPALGMARLSVSIAFLCLFLSTAGCSGGSDEKAAGKDAGKPAAEGEADRTDVDNKKPDLSGVRLTKLDGTVTSIGDYSGKILYVTFWATWHEDSRKVIPIMHEIQKKFGKNVQVLAVAMDRQGASVVRGWLMDKEVNFDVFIDGERTANAFGGARKLPVTYIVLRDGDFFHRIDGLSRKREYEDIILAMYRQHL
ncbi:MAG: TlpA family protein disulfide reductase [Candidatus Krumholzibacteria bacterium]|nr:TlpA family protein disulfide reductase [Candidatus Krumholzibacteria bacterium]